ncbi:hypothetical protein B0H13DRAFT_2333563 [Mycena leptocephala]|nr:hypothetical protein B0H13DRAFT_2333563 [Mycena leptocephala]
MEKLLGAAELERVWMPLFEEILHRVPGVKTLEIVFCGPETCAEPSKYARNYSDCRRRGRKTLRQRHLDIATYVLAVYDLDADRSNGWPPEGEGGGGGRVFCTA